MPAVRFPDDDELGFSWSRISTGWGCGAALSGLVLLYHGIASGLIPLARSSGERLGRARPAKVLAALLAAATCSRVDIVPGSPLIEHSILGVAVLATGLAGLAALLAVAEPALRMLAVDVRCAGSSQIWPRTVQVVHAQRAVTPPVHRAGCSWAGARRRCGVHQTGLCAPGLAGASGRQVHHIPASAVLIPGYAAMLAATLCAPELSSR